MPKIPFVNFAPQANAPATTGVRASPTLLSPFFEAQGNVARAAGQLGQMPSELATIDAKINAEYDNARISRALQEAQVKQITFNSNLKDADVNDLDAEMLNWETVKRDISKLTPKGLSRNAQVAWKSRLDNFLATSTVEVNSVIRAKKIQVSRNEAQSEIGLAVSMGNPAIVNDVIKKSEQNGIFSTQEAKIIRDKEIPNAIYANAIARGNAFPALTLKSLDNGEYATLGTMRENSLRNHLNHDMATQTQKLVQDWSARNMEADMGNGQYVPEEEIRAAAEKYGIPNYISTKFLYKEWKKTNKTTQEQDGDFKKFIDVTQTPIQEFEVVIGNDGKVVELKDGDKVPKRDKYTNELVYQNKSWSDFSPIQQARIIGWANSFKGSYKTNADKIISDLRDTDRFINVNKAAVEEAKEINRKHLAEIPIAYKTIPIYELDDEGKPQQRTDFNGKPMTDKITGKPLYVQAIDRMTGQPLYRQDEDARAISWAIRSDAMDELLRFMRSQKDPANVSAETIAQHMRVFSAPKLQQSASTGLNKQ